MKSFFRCALISALCCLVSFIVFAPRFYLWSGIGNPYFAETDRASLELVQLNDPFTSFPNSGNQFLQWRILFPVIGHSLHMPWKFFFALPMLFCFLMVLYVSCLCHRETQSDWMAFAGAALAATFAAFFVSFGFLGYFDSALLLMILAAAFSRRGVIVWAAASLGPWIDERFLYALPIVLWCRWVQSRKENGNPQPHTSTASEGLSAAGFFQCALPVKSPSAAHPRVRWLRVFDQYAELKTPSLGTAGLLVLLGIAPYLAARIFSFLCGNGTDYTQSYLSDILHSPHNAGSILLGVRDGLRWAWVLAIAAFVGAPELPRIVGLVIIPLMLALLIVGAGDYSRSMAVAFPLALVGLFWAWRKSPRVALGVGLTLAVLSFVTPAYHSFRAFHQQIYPLTIQLKIQKMIQTGDQKGLDKIQGE